MEELDLNHLSKTLLLAKCDELGITKCKSKKKGELVELIHQKQMSQRVPLQKPIEFSLKKDEKTNTDSNEIQTIPVFHKTRSRNYTLVDLFCGTGAFSYAFHRTNKVETIFANDISDSSEEIFNMNNVIQLTKRNVMDMNDTDIPNSDILTAGFPCQPFSIAGMQKGFEDERSHVFWKIVSILKKNKPNIVILENVKNLQSHDNGNTFQIIIENLKTLNYYIKYNILNTSKITGIPQNRERIYIVCFKDKTMSDHFNFDFPEIELKCVSEFLEKDVPERFYYDHSTRIYDELKTNVIKHISTNTVYQYRRYYVRENKNRVCPTLTANMGGGGHNVPIILDDKGIRKLTPKECFNLQGFPKDYKLPSISMTQLYRLAGNAVSVPVVSLIAERIMNCLL